MDKLQKRDVLHQRLEIESDPSRNSFLWRLLTPEQLLTLVFESNNSFNENLLSNCDRKQIEEMLKEKKCNRKRKVALENLIIGRRYGQEDK